MPENATDWWTGHTAHLAQWHNNEWSFSIPMYGHGISLPDGRIFELIDGLYIEKIALDVQSGRRVYAEDISTDVNAVVVNPAPAIAGLTAGLGLRIKVKNSNTGAVRIAVSDYQAQDLVRLDGSPLSNGDLVAGGIHDVVYDGERFQLQNPFAAQQLHRDIDLYVNGAIGNDVNDGSANDADHAMATIQGAVNRAILYGPSSYMITIYVADGNYDAVSIPNPSAVVVDSETGHAFAVHGPLSVVVSGIRAQTSRAGSGLAGFFSDAQAYLAVTQCETGNIGTAAL